MTTRGPRRYNWLVFLILGLMALGAVLKACTEAENRSGDETAAPVPAGVVRTFGEGDDGARASVAVGETFAVTLRSWAEWRVEASPPFLRHVETRKGPAVEGDAEGADQWQVLVFEATTAGEGDLRLVLARPWEAGDRLAEYRLGIEATAGPAG